ncbi:MAG: L-aspartate oxidase [Bacteroidetes bacterium]|jgi:L-aspartate oxidase|nr:L-aspartate oxidase [Bacteroidota bacterium]
MLGSLKKKLRIRAICGANVIENPLFSYFFYLYPCGMGIFLQQKEMEERFDFLVIGSGLAGLSFALKVADKGKVAIVTKAGLSDTNTSYAQGGIAAVTYAPDNFEKHSKDTLIAGDGLCNTEIVEMVVKEAPGQIKQLIEWGAEFDKESNGKFNLAREGGHSEHRILHHKDNTGFEVQRALAQAVKKHPNITIFEYFFAIDIITQHHLGKLVKRYFPDIECFGAYVLELNSGIIHTFLARVTMIATGGIGNLYHMTTNPMTATGDGIAMVYRAKGIVDNMEFVQFHPTALYHPGERPLFLITEAMRGHGAILRNHTGEDFMMRYDSRGSLAPRDIVARAIDNEMKASGDEYVFLDCTHLDGNDLKESFPHIYEKCKSVGIDITRDRIPVVPAAHFLCGGIQVDANACSSIQRLYAAGETTFTGLHGANRLASNSLIEAIIFADKAARHALPHFQHYSIPQGIPQWNDAGTTNPEEIVLITQNYKEVQQIFSYYVGIVRSNLRLKRAMDRLEIIFNETEDLYAKSKLSQKLCELRNMINVGYLIIKMAQQRKESRGLHYTIDYPYKNPTNANYQ